MKKFLKFTSFPIFMSIKEKIEKINAESDSKFEELERQKQAEIAGLTSDYVTEIDKKYTAIIEVAKAQGVEALKTLDDKLTEAENMILPTTKPVEGQITIDRALTLYPILRDQYATGEEFTAKQVADLPSIATDSKNPSLSIAAYLKTLSKDGKVSYDGQSWKLEGKVDYDTIKAAAFNMLATEKGREYGITSETLVEFLGLPKNDAKAVGTHLTRFIRKNDDWTSSRKGQTLYYFPKDEKPDVLKERDWLIGYVKSEEFSGRIEKELIRENCPHLTPSQARSMLINHKIGLKGSSDNKAYEIPNMAVN